jgi:mannitol/fructose-specific phosphotransferase system IIA component (Ntr-type)
MALIDGLVAVGMLVMLYAALATYYAITYKKQLMQLQQKLENYESAATFAQAGDFKDAIKIRNNKPGKE